MATENPGYYLGKCLLEQSGLRAVGLPLNPFSGLELERWQSLLDEHRPGLVYLTSRFQNPTGYSYSSGELQQIIAWSRQLGFGILEDDWGSDMLSFSEFTPCLRALGGENVLYVNSFTKKLWPSLRIGYLVASAGTVEPLIASKRVSCLGSPALIERGLYDFLEQGYYDAFLKRVQLELDRRYRHCLDLLDELMPEEVRWTSPGGGPQLWLELPSEVDLAGLTARLRARRVVVDTRGGSLLRPPAPARSGSAMPFCRSRTCVAAWGSSPRRSGLPERSPGAFRRADPELCELARQPLGRVERVCKAAVLAPVRDENRRRAEPQRAPRRALRKPYSGGSRFRARAGRPARGRAALPGARSDRGIRAAAATASD